MRYERVMRLGGLPIAAGLLALRSDATRLGEPLAYLNAGRKLAMTDIFRATLMCISRNSI